MKWIAVYCSAKANEGNSKWNETLATGQTVNGICLSGYNGSISRTCTQSGSTGNWDSITGSCDGILFFYIFYIFYIFLFLYFFLKLCFLLFIFF